MKGGTLAAAVLATAAVAGCSLSGSPATAGGTGRPTTGGPHPAASAQPFPAAENARRGTAGWYIHDLGAPDAIEGYADRVSVLPGQSFRLFVSTTSPRFRVQAFRMGWYHGRRARQVWRSGEVKGRAQPRPTIAKGTRMVSTRWRPSLTVPTTGWPEGAYLLRLDASRGPERYVPVTVRSATTAGKVVLVMGVTTWQAYNLWGGYSLYDGPSGTAGRSYAVSFDRPYEQNGASLFTVFDEPPLALA